MDTITNGGWNIDFTGHFNGEACQIIEEYHIILDKGGRSSREFVESNDSHSPSPLEV